MIAAQRTKTESHLIKKIWRQAIEVRKFQKEREQNIGEAIQHLLKIGQGPVVLDDSRNSLGSLNTDAVPAKTANEKTDTTN